MRTKAAIEAELAVSEKALAKAERAVEREKNANWAKQDTINALIEARDFLVAEVAEIREVLETTRRLAAANENAGLVLDGVVREREAWKREAEISQGERDKAREISAREKDVAQSNYAEAREVAGKCMSLANECASWENANAELEEQIHEPLNEQRIWREKQKESDQILVDALRKSSEAEQLVRDLKIYTIQNLENSITELQTRLEEWKKAAKQAAEERNELAGKLGAIKGALA